MTHHKKHHGKDSCCSSSSIESCCKVEAMAAVDERGQMVLPKEVREKAGIRAGDKLAVVSCGGDDSSCIALIKADKFEKIVKDFLGPMMKDIFK